MLRIHYIPLTVGLLICSLDSEAQADLAFDYGQLPEIRNLTISPNGDHFAFIQRMEGGEIFTVVDAGRNEAIGGGSVTNLKARGVQFATNKHLLVQVSKTAGSLRIRGKWEASAPVAYNVETGEWQDLLKIDGLFPAQSGLGRIVGVNRAEEVVYMPAFMGSIYSSHDPANHLLRVDLNTGRAKVHAKGTIHTIDWFVDDQGNVIAREEYNERKQLHSIQTRASGKWKVIWVDKTEVPRTSFAGVTDDFGRLVLIKGTGEYDAVFTLSLSSGEMTGPHNERDDAEIDNVLTHPITRVVWGVQYSGPLPQYTFFNDIGSVFARVQASYPTSALYPTATGGNKLLLLLSGNQGAEDYLIYDAERQELSRIARGYPDIAQHQIGKITAITYSARDGYKIPAILTWPPDQEKSRNLPAIVFPHGGPETYDRIAFDWWAQFFARSGYLVLQPNYRGSTGYGRTHQMAGRGQWGRLMQDDISDGVAALVKNGYADANRICIAGASYGGYAALAGGAYTPDLYRCVIAVAPVTDLPYMLYHERATLGARHWVVSYWENVIGDSKAEREKLEAVSPVNAADQFLAPVLLIHGKDDSVVPYAHSKRMRRALKRKKAEVELVDLKGEDHWLSRGETREDMLRAIGVFLQEHNPS